jgi:phospholipase/lecithinase/hemolysin
LTVDKLITFGDSLTDNGNFYAYTFHYIPKNPPYYEGRFSNGPTWAEDLAEMLHLAPTEFVDNAYGGATAREARNDVAWQLNDYIQHAGADQNRAQHLYVLWAGANDYMPGRGEPEQETDTTIAAIESHLETLVTKIHAQQILVITLPDLSRTPLASVAGTGFASTVSKDIELHNAKLVTLVQKLQSKYPAIKFVLFDVLPIFNDAIAHPEHYGLKNTSDACYIGDAFMYSAVAGPQFADMRAQSRRYLDQACQDADQHLFWDHVHPTKPVHQIIAREVFKAIS